MSTSQRIDPTLLEHLLVQHRDLHARLQTLRAAFSDPANRGSVDLRAALGDLRTILQEHFVQEEAGGFIEESIARIPRLASAARDVMAEHPRLLDELDGLLESLSVLDISPAGWRSARERFNAFADHLLAHERNEHAVVQDGYNEDFGLDD